MRLFSLVRYWHIHSTVKLLIAVLSSVIGFGLASTATAQAPADLLLLQQQQEELIRQQQLEEEVRDFQNDLRRQPPTSTPDTQTTSVQTGTEGPCIQVDVIKFLGASKLIPQQQRKIIGPYVGKCIGLNQINEILRAATNLYIDRGYITSRVVIPEQDLSDGSLELQVVEGYIEDIVRAENAGFVSLMTAFPGLRGKLLNLRDIEQGLDQINRLASNYATMRLLPGSKPGQSVISVDNESSRRFSLSSGVDNYGSASTGEIKGNTTLRIDNPLRLNDQLVLSYSRNLEEPSQDALSQNYSVNYSVPWGYWTLSAGYSFFDYVSELKGQVAAFDTDGNGNTSTLSLSRVLRRDQKSKTTLTGTLTRKDNVNFVENNKLAASSRVTTVADLTAVHTFAALGASFTVDLGLSRGLGILGAEDNPEFAGSPEDEFLLIHGGASFAKVSQVGQMVYGATSNLTVQASADRIPGTEQISIGGVNTVRGFQNRAVSGVSGLYARNEAYAILPGKQDGGFRKWIGSVRPYIAVDIGHIFAQPDLGVADNSTLFGGAAGLRAVGGYLSFDIAIAKGIYGVDGYEYGSSAADVYFKLGARF